VSLDLPDRSRVANLIKNCDTSKVKDGKLQKSEFRTAFKALLKFCVCEAEKNAKEENEQARAVMPNGDSHHISFEQHAAAERIQATQGARTMRDGKRPDPQGNYSPEQAQAAERIQAIQRGRAARAGVAGKAKKTFSDEEVRAARQLQGMYRIWSARRKCAGLNQKGGGAIAFYKAATVINSKHKAWVELYDSAIDEQGGNCKNLQEPAFSAILMKVHPRLSAAQVEQLWSGIIEGLGREDVDVKTWCQLCQAVAVGDQRAAEFADIATEDFVALGTPKKTRKK